MKPRKLGKSTCIKSQFWGLIAFMGIPIVSFMWLWLDTRSPSDSSQYDVTLNLHLCKTMIIDHHHHRHHLHQVEAFCQCFMWRQIVKLETEYREHFARSLLAPCNALSGRHDSRKSLLPVSASVSLPAQKTRHHMLWWRHKMISPVSQLFHIYTFSWSQLMGLAWLRQNRLSVWLGRRVTSKIKLGSIWLVGLMEQTASTYQTNKGRLKPKFLQSSP